VYCSGADKIPVALVAQETYLAKGGGGEKFLDQRTLFARPDSLMADASDLAGDPCAGQRGARRQSN